MLRRSKYFNSNTEKYLLSCFTTARQRALRQGNVFSRVCLSVYPQGWGVHVTITNDALDLTTDGLFVHCSNLFNLDLSVQGQPRPRPWIPSLPRSVGWHPPGMLSC